MNNNTHNYSVGELIKWNNEYAFVVTTRNYNGIIVPEMIEYRDSRRGNSRENYGRIPVSYISNGNNSYWNILGCEYLLEVVEQSKKEEPKAIKDVVAYYYSRSLSRI